MAPKKQLTPEQYNVCFLGQTEPPFSGKYTHTMDPGTYHCVSCDTPLFSSETKYESDTGWPSFFAPIDEARLKQLHDTSHGLDRIEIRCAVCDAHLGHVFDDGPKPDKKHYCINSLALQFVPQASYTK